MAEHPNVALVRKVYEAFARGDTAALTKLFDENVVWHYPGKSPLAGEFRGRDAVFAWFDRLGELSGGTFQMEVHDILANDGHVVVLAHYTASRPRKQFESRYVEVYHVRDGEITEVWDFSEDQRLDDEFWS